MANKEKKSASSPWCFSTSVHLRTRVVFCDRTNVRSLKIERCELKKHSMKIRYSTISDTLFLLRHPDNSPDIPRWVKSMLGFHFLEKWMLFKDSLNRFAHDRSHVTRVFSLFHRCKEIRIHIYIYIYWIRYWRSIYRSIVIICGIEFRYMITLCRYI